MFHRSFCWRVRWLFCHLSCFHTQNIAFYEPNSSRIFRFVRYYWLAVHKCCFPFASRFTIMMNSIDMCSRLIIHNLTRASSEAHRLAARRSSFWLPICFVCLESVCLLPEVKIPIERLSCRFRPFSLLLLSAASCSKLPHCVRYQILHSWCDAVCAARRRRRDRKLVLETFPSSSRTIKAIDICRRSEKTSRHKTREKEWSSKAARECCRSRLMTDLISRNETQFDVIFTQIGNLYCQSGRMSFEADACRLICHGKTCEIFP